MSFVAISRQQILGGEPPQLTKILQPRYRTGVFWGFVDMTSTHFTRRFRSSRVGQSDVMASSLIKSPETTAGRRQLSVPAYVMKSVEGHLERFTGAESQALVLASPEGEPISIAVLQRAWTKARSSIGRDELHLHDYADTPA